MGIVFNDILEKRISYWALFVMHDLIVRLFLIWKGHNFNGFFRMEVNLTLLWQSTIPDICIPVIFLTMFSFLFRLFATVSFLYLFTALHNFLLHTTLVQMSSIRDVLIAVDDNYSGDCYIVCHLHQHLHQAITICLMLPVNCVQLAWYVLGLWLPNA